MSEIKPVSIKTAKQRLKEKYPEVIDHFQCDVLFATQDEVKELRAALEALQAELEEKRILLEKIETLCTHDYESKDDFILRVKDSLSAQKGTEP
jgi:hypothetical protein